MKRKCQVHLRTLLVVIAIAAIAFACIGYKLNSYYRQKRIADQLAAAGARIEYRFGNVIGVFYSRAAVLGQAKPITLAQIRQINQLTHLEWLHFNYTDITDELLLEVEGLDRLQSLGVEFTGVTSEGLDKLQGSSNLVQLRVDVGQLTPETEEYLKRRYPDLNLIKWGREEGVVVVVE